MRQSVKIVLTALKGGFNGRKESIQSAGTGGKALNTGPQDQETHTGDHETTGEYGQELRPDRTETPADKKTAPARRLADLAQKRSLLLWG